MPTPAAPLLTLTLTPTLLLDGELLYELPDQLPDQPPDQLPKLKYIIDDPAQVVYSPTKRQTGDRSATAAALPFITPPPTSPAPIYKTEARVDLALPATATAQAIGNSKGGWVDLIGSPTLIDLTISPTPAYSPLRPLSSSALIVLLIYYPGNRDKFYIILIILYNTVTFITIYANIPITQLPELLGLYYIHYYNIN